MKTFVIAIVMFGAFFCMAATPTKAACRFGRSNLVTPGVDPEGEAVCFMLVTMVPRGLYAAV
jgi:hypothetical protein